MRRNARSASTQSKRRSESNGITFEQGGNLTTFLFTWNPTKYQHLYRDREQWLEETLPDFNWSSGNNKSIPSGSRFFLMRQGVEPKGIVGAGHTTSEWRVIDHFDGTPGKKENCND